MWTFFVIHIDLSNSSMTVIYAKNLKSSKHLDILHADAQMPIL